MVSLPWVVHVGTARSGAGVGAVLGFGAGASATVFGARGSANFLSRSTAVLAFLFFALSLGMAAYVSRSGESRPTVADLGVMGEVPAAVTAPVDSEVPVMDGGATDAPSSEAPAAMEAPTESAPVTAPAEGGTDEGTTEGTEASPQDDASGQ